MSESGGPSGSASYTSFDTTANASQQESSPLRTSTVNQSRTGWIKDCLDPQDGLKIIIISFVVFSLAVTVALAVQISYGSPQIEPHFAVATDYRHCSEIGVKVLKDGGTAIDAAIASMFCLSVVHPHVTGLGGGGYLLFHDHRHNKTNCLNFRELSPAALNDSGAAGAVPGSLIGVPGFLKGLEYAHMHYGGKKKWEQLVDPAFDLATNGFNVSKFLADALKNKMESEKNANNAELRNMFTGADGKLVTTGNTMKNKKLGDTLKIVGLIGSTAFYEERLGKNIAEAVRDAGGSMTSLDLKAYSVVEEECIPLQFGDSRVWVPPAPSGGALTVNILNILNGVTLHKDASSWASILKASALALINENQQASEAYTNFALNETVSEDYRHLLGDGSPPSNISFPIRHQTAASVVAVMDNEDRYVSLVSGLGDWFGSGLATQGFIMNSALNSFHTEAPDESMFYPDAEKRPPTLITPLVIEDMKQVCKTRMVSGAADAEGMVDVLLNYLVHKQSFSDSIDDSRIHLGSATSIFLESDHNRTISAKVVKQLEEFGYISNEMKPPYSSINAIEKYKDSLRAHSDSRGGGVASRYG